MRRIASEDSVRFEKANRDLYRYLKNKTTEIVNKKKLGQQVGHSRQYTLTATLHVPSGPMGLLLQSSVHPIQVINLEKRGGLVWF